MAVKKLSPKELRAHKGVSFPGITTAFLCHDGQGKLFLARRSKNTRDEHGRWDVGAGGLKLGQSLEANLRRELKEEYDADAKRIDFLGYLDAFRTGTDGQPTHWLAMFFIVLVDPKQVKINEPDMIDEAGWFSLDELPSPMHSQFPAFYKKFGDQLRVIINPK